MTKPARPLPSPSHARHPRPRSERPEVKPDSMSIGMGGDQAREGGENSGPVGAETGAGATFSENGVSGGGSTNGETRQLVGGWREVNPGEDPGVGFYRFRASAIPDLDFSVGRLGAVVEFFAVSLNDAQKRLGFMRAKRARGSSADPVRVTPLAHRATRLPKRSRKAAEAASK